MTRRRHSGYTQPGPIRFLRRTERTMHRAADGTMQWALDERGHWQWKPTKRPPFAMRAENRRRNAIAKRSRKANR